MQQRAVELFRQRAERADEELRVERSERRREAAEYDDAIRSLKENSGAEAAKRRDARPT